MKVDQYARGSSDSHAIGYRPDIDGLRAVAVVSVILFHMGRLSGGFVGVDIFFVISGYLICSIISAEMVTGRFTVAKFYERRIRRIFPALLALLIVLTSVAVWQLVPADREEFGRTAVAAALSVSNIYFATQTGYFAPEAESEPLLHTWSLGVEEQFYLVFPLLLLLGYRYFPRRIAAVTVAIFALSLGASTLAALQRDVGAFYWLHDRAWELAIGAWLALDPIPPLRAPRAKEAVAGAGAIAILASLAILSRKMPLPGIVLLPACSGAAAVIYAGQGTWTGRALSLRPVVFVGLISYSLYLWHWPVIVLQKQTWLFYAGESRLAELTIVLAVMFAASVLSWWLVERPFRKSFPRKRGTLFALAAFVVLGVCGAASALIFTHGAPAFNASRENAFGRYLGYDTTKAWQLGDCLGNREGPFTLPLDKCLALSTSKPNVVLIGDSHAEGMYVGLLKALPEYNVRTATIPSCRPVLGLADATENCRRLLDFVFGPFLDRHGSQIGLLVLQGWWLPPQADAVIATARELKRRGVPFVIVGPITGYDVALPRLLMLEAKTGDRSLHDRHRDRAAEQLDSYLASRAREIGFPYISLAHVFCEPDGCRATIGAVPVQFDAFHLTAEGSMDLAQKIAPQLRHLVRVR